MPADRVHDTITDKDATRLKIHKQGHETNYSYSDGTEVRVEKSAEGNGRGLKEIREVRRVLSPKVRISVPYRDDQYERIFRGGEK